MIEQMKDLPADVIGLRASGKVSKQDYDEVFEPLLDEARRRGQRVRFLYQFGPDFEGFTPGGAWEDAKLGLRSMQRFAGCAIVSDLGWLREATRAAGFFMPCPVRVFSNRDRDAAIEWLAQLPGSAALSHRLLPESGVIVVEVTRALKAEDFDALGATADAWIESHDHLNGLVLHAHHFPGWEKAGSLLRHIRFVRDHHKHIKRVALVADSKLAELMPRLAEHFVDAELKTFGYDDVNVAIAWAAEASTSTIGAET